MVTIRVCESSVSLSERVFKKKSGANNLQARRSRTRLTGRARGSRHAHMARVGTMIGTTPAQFARQDEAMRKRAIDQDYSK